MDVIRDLVGIAAAGGGQCLRQHLHCRVRRHLKTAHGIAFLVQESLFDGSVGRIGRKVCRLRNQEPFRRGAGDGIQILVARAFGADENRFQTLLARLAQQ